MKTTVDVRALSVRLGDTAAVVDVSASAASGEWLTLIGPNGAGKTTVLRAVAGLVSFSGSIRVEDCVVRAARRREIARRVALVPQTPESPGELTVAEYVLLGRTPHLGYLGAETCADRAAAARAVDHLALRAFVGRSLATLSGGELQRVVLARALAQEATVLLLDEPTSALDLGRQQHVLELIDALRRRLPLTVIAAMHDLTLAGQYADRLLVLDKGRVVASGRPSEVLSEQLVGDVYGASVRVIRNGESVFVLPARGER